MEKEAAIYFPLIEGTWKEKFEVFIMYGDEKQLQPIIDPCHPG
jgi:hypothetical protein